MLPLIESRRVAPQVAIAAYRIVMTSGRRFPPLQCLVSRARKKINGGKSEGDEASKGPRRHELSKLDIHGDKQPSRRARFTRRAVVERTDATAERSRPDEAAVATCAAGRSKSRRSVNNASWG